MVAGFQFLAGDRTTHWMQSGTTSLKPDKETHPSKSMLLVIAGTPLSGRRHASSRDGWFGQLSPISSAPKPPKPSVLRRKPLPGFSNCCCTKEPMGITGREGSLASRFGNVRPNQVRHAFSLSGVSQQTFTQPQVCWVDFVVVPWGVGGPPVVVLQKYRIWH